MKPNVWLAAMGAAVAAPLAVIGSATPASAAWDGYEFVYHFHSYSYAADHLHQCGFGLGAAVSFIRNDKDLANDNFDTYCPNAHGGGIAVKNNAGSAVNFNHKRVRVYYNSFAVMGCWCGSTYDTLAGDNSAGSNGVRSDLASTKNDNASHRRLP